MVTSNVYKLLAWSIVLVFQNPATQDGIRSIIRVSIPSSLFWHLQFAQETNILSSIKICSRAVSARFYKKNQWSSRVPKHLRSIWNIFSTKVICKCPHHL